MGELGVTVAPFLGPHQISPVSEDSADIPGLPECNYAQCRWGGTDTIDLLYYQIPWQLCPLSLT